MCPERVYIFISLCVAPYLYRDPMPHIVLWCWKRNARMCIIIQAVGGTPFCALLRTLALLPLKQGGYRVTRHWKIEPTANTRENINTHTHTHTHTHKPTKTQCGVAVGGSGWGWGLVLVGQGYPR